jgi:hypothetical protein
MKTAYVIQLGCLWERDETNMIVQSCGLLPGLCPGKIYHCYVAFLTALSCKLTDHFTSVNGHCNILVGLYSGDKVSIIATHITYYLSNIGPPQVAKNMQCIADRIKALFWRLWSSL